MKIRVLIIAVAFFVALPAFARNDPNGIQITTKSPQAHMYFERGLQKMQLKHFQAGLENWRKAVAADPHFALGHIFLACFSQDPSEQVVEREKALANRQYAGAEEQLIIGWLANASQSNWIPAIQAMNGALERYPHDKYLTWMAGWWLELNQNQSSRALAKRPTKAFQDALAQGGTNLRILGLPGAVPVEGGIPFIADGKVIGAIGLSGDSSEHDGQCATADAATIK